MKTKPPIQLSGKRTNGRKSPSHGKRNPGGRSRSENTQGYTIRKGYDDHLGAFAASLRRRGFASGTVALRCFLLRKFGQWLAESGINDPLAVTPKDLADYQVHLATENDGKYSVGYQSNFIVALRNFYGWLHAERLILTNPAKRLEFARQPRRLCREVLTVPELKQLVGAPVTTAAQLRDKAAASLLVMSGARALELCGIDLDDVNLAEREVVIRHGKGGRKRLVFFDPGTRATLSRYLVHARPTLAQRKVEALVVGDRGQRLSPDRLCELVQRRVKRCGIHRHITTHSLRHTFCTQLLRHGANVKVIAELAGHRSLDTTANYTRADIGELAAIYRQAHPRSAGHE